MKLSLTLTTLALALTASASPISNTQPAEPKAAAISGSGTNGSIFMFGSASACRQVFYDFGACGLSTFFADKVPASMPLVAVPSGIFDRFGEAQDNSLCAKVITLTHNGVTRQAVVADENTSSEQSIDMCLDLWQAFGGHDADGSLITNFSWSIAA